MVSRWRAGIGYALLALLLFVVSVIGKAILLWFPLIQFDAGCEHPPLPPNRSGMKVLVAGFGKTGTRTISHALNRIGIRTYHSEDMVFFSWREFSKKMMQREEYRHLNPGYMTIPLNSDPTAPEEWAASLSRCRVKGFAMDGLENLFWPTYHVSPDVKVIVMDWRDFQSYDRSMSVFMPKLVTMCWWCVLSGASTHVPPWSVLLKVLDRLVGRPIEKAIKDGGPPITEVSGPMMFFYQQSVNHYNHYTTFTNHSDGTAQVPGEAGYYAYFETIKQAVPADRRMSCDPRKTTYEDLCRFMDISPCPAKGKLPKAINTWIWERDFPLSNFLVVTVRLYLWWVNWRLLLGFVSLARRLLRCGSKKGKKVA